MFFGITELRMWFWLNCKSILN